MGVLACYLVIEAENEKFYNLVVNLLFWPASILWDPVSGYDGAQSINYDMTKTYLRKEKGKELIALEELLIADQIDSKTYLIEKRKIEQKYEY